MDNSFNGCSFRDAVFSYSSIEACEMIAADLTNAYLAACTVKKLFAINAVWVNTRFEYTRLVDVVFEGSLIDCCFDNCSFVRVTFRNADLVRCFFKGKSLKSIRFYECQADSLSYAYLRNGKADLNGISLDPSFATA